jgi:hypothetical protein
MIREGVPKNDALDVCERLPETFTEFLAERGARDVQSAADSAFSAPEAPEPPENGRRRRRWR